MMADIYDVQQIEVYVQGPNDINRMYITTGRILCHLNAEDDTLRSNGRTEEKTVSALIDPELPVGAFRRAIATASLSNVKLDILTPPTEGEWSSQLNFAWDISNPQADFDDENNKVQLFVTLSATASGQRNKASIIMVSFQVTTLASLPQPIPEPIE
jgi:hypothetical protein